MKWIPKGSGEGLSILDITYQRVPCNINFFLQVIKRQKNDLGYLDSDSSRHMTCEKNKFTKLNLKASD